jgi:hypothetical protein
MDTRLDNQFKQINGLTWLPWVGEKYFNIPPENRMFIIGESHYHDGTEQSKKNCEPSSLTREIIEDLAIDRNYYGTKIFQNLHRTLFRNDEFDAEKFWGLVPFYNFIQRPMETNLGRPVYEEYFSGWKIFFELHKLLKPKICLFIGTTYANSLHHAIIDTGLNADEVKFEDWISNAYAKSSKLYSSNIETTLIFIRHTSQMYSWDKWNRHLENKIGGQLHWLKSEIDIAR